MDMVDFKGGGAVYCGWDDMWAFNILRDADWKDDLPSKLRIEGEVEKFDGRVDFTRNFRGEENYHDIRIIRLNVFYLSLYF